MKEELKKKIDEWVESLDFDETELPSYHYDHNPYCVEPQLIGTSGVFEWDEDEEYQAKLNRAVELIEADGAFEYLDTPEEDEEEIKKEVLDYINQKIE